MSESRHRRLSYIIRTIGGGAFLGLMIGQGSALLFGYDLPRPAGYGCLIAGAIIGLALAVSSEKVRQVEIEEPRRAVPEKLRQAVEAYQDNRRAHERRLCEMEATRLGISVDDMHAAYCRIWKGMEYV